MKLKAIFKKVSVLLAVLLFFAFFPNVPLVAYGAASTTLSADSADILKDKVVVEIVLKSGSKSAKLNNKAVTLDTAVTPGAKPLVTGKFLVESLQGIYSYSPATRKITIKKGSTSITLKIGSKNAAVNGKTVTLTSAPMVSGSRALLPASFIAEKLGASFSCNLKTKASVIKLKAKYIDFPDPALKKVILKKLNRTSGDVLLTEAQKARDLYISGPEVTDINGIQYFTSVTELNMKGTSVSSIAPISSLTKLQFVFLSENKIIDLSPLSNLRSISVLDLSGNPVSDLKPLSVLDNLMTLFLRDTQVSDLNPLRSMKKIRTVFIWDAKNLETAYLIEAKAKEIVNRLITPDMSEYEKELAIYDYLIINSNYDKQNYDAHTIPAESHQAYGILINGTGVCDGYANALKVLLNTSGIEAYVVSGDSSGPDDKGYENFTHAWNIARIDGRYYHLDATYDDTIRKNGLSHRYFNLSDQQMEVDHVWDRTKYPECNSIRNNYALSRSIESNYIKTDDWIYGIYKDGLYKYKKDGSALERICTDDISHIALSGDVIYYSNNSDEYKLYSIKTDGTQKTRLTVTDAVYPVISGDYIYFINDYHVYKMKLGTVEKTALSTEDAIASLDISDDWIYYKGFNWEQGARLYRVKPDGSQKATIINDALAGFTLVDGGSSVEYSYAKSEILSGEYIYYTNASDGNKLYKIKCDGTGRTKLSDDPIDPYSIELVDDYVYYLNSTEDKFYRIKTDGSMKVCIG